MFSISLQDVLQSRMIELVWFTLSLINTMSLLLFWVAGFSNSGVVGSTTLPFIQHYYLFLIIAGQGLMSHVEETVWRYDIKEGGLVKYLLRPVSYFWSRFWLELPWRFGGLQFAIIGFILISLLLKLRVVFPPLAIWPLILITIVLGYLLSFVYKMILAMSAFWITEGWSLFEVMDTVMLLLSGFLMPLSFYPDWLQRLANIMPFAYMIYYPIQGMMGQLSTPILLKVILIQALWLSIAGLTYKFIWRKGIRTFTGIGQ
jgi:ABC-2 type transport system permease protein